MPQDRDTPLGFEAARHVVDLDRAAFFASPDDDLPSAESAQVASDDLLPQFGFVGNRYARLRVLLLGINPGNGPRSERSTGDKVIMPALSAFVANPIPKTFLVAQRAYREVCQGWAVWGRQCNELLREAGLDMEDIAFTNALP
jgi:hypothetical protein